MPMLEDIDTPKILRERADSARCLAHAIRSEEAAQYLMNLAGELDDEALNLEEDLYQT